MEANNGGSSRAGAEESAQMKRLEGELRKLLQNGESRESVAQFLAMLKECAGKEQKNGGVKREYATKPQPTSSSSTTSTNHSSTRHQFCGTPSSSRPPPPETAKRESSRSKNGTATPNKCSSQQNTSKKSTNNKNCDPLNRTPRNRETSPGFIDPKTFYDALIIAWSKVKSASKTVAILLKDILTLLGCFLLIVLIIGLKFTWAAFCKILKFSTLIIIFVFIWCSQRLKSVWRSTDDRFNVYDRSAAFLSSCVGIVEVIVGVEVRSRLSAWRRKQQHVVEEDDNIVPQLPETSQQAVTFLLNQKQHKPFRTLCVPLEASDEQVRQNYRAIARLVHPDKCDLPQADDAFKIMDAAFKKISDEESRRTVQEEQQTANFDRFFQSTEMKDLLEKMMSQMNCAKCGQTHERNVQKNRLPEKARYCKECSEYHPAVPGDVWAETNAFGLSWICYTFANNNQVYEITEWALCNGLGRVLDTNLHTAQCSLGDHSKQQHKPPRNMSRKQQRQQERQQNKQNSSNSEGRKKKTKRKPK